MKIFIFTLLENWESYALDSTDFIADIMSFKQFRYIAGI